MDLEIIKKSKYAKYLLVVQNEEDEKQGLSREEQMAKWKSVTEAQKPFMEKYENPYIHISHGEDKKLFMFTPGDHILIQEKIDGSNAHLVAREGGFDCYGMNYHLNDKNTLQGFYHWCKDHYKNILSEFYGMKIYGEWLIPHHCEYQESFYCNFYVFDIMDGNSYLPQDEVKRFCELCNFSYVPVLYDGPFISWKETQKYIGQTVMGKNKGEGIVVKNISKLNKANKLFYIKLVDKEYQETHPARELIKALTPEALEEEDNRTSLVASIMTQARIRKIILKKVDIGLLPTYWKTLDAKAILKVVKKDLISDCYKEEREVVSMIGKNFANYAESLITSSIEKLKNDD